MNLSLSFKEELIMDIVDVIADQSDSHVYIPTVVRRGQEFIDLVFDLTGGRGFICGGFARWACSIVEQPIVPNDIDVFCGDETTYEAIASRFTNDSRAKQQSDTAIETKYNIVLRGGFDQRTIAVQLIKPTTIFNMVATGDWINVLDNFDFTIAKCAILPTGDAWAHVDFDIHEAAKALVITNIHCPISSMKRVIKYTSKGYTIESAELLKLFVDYENRSPQWKELVHWGLTTTDLPSTSDDRWRLFVETMYFD